MMNGWMRSSNYVEEENGKRNREIHDLLRLFATRELLKKKNRETYELIFSDVV